MNGLSGSVDGSKPSFLGAGRQPEHDLRALAGCSSGSGCFDRQVRSPSRSLLRVCKGNIGRNEILLGHPPRNRKAGRHTFAWPARRGRHVCCRKKCQRLFRPKDYYNRFLCVEFKPQSFESSPNNQDAAQYPYQKATALP